MHCCIPAAQALLHLSLFAAAPLYSAHTIPHAHASWVDNGYRNVAFVSDRQFKGGEEQNGVSPDRTPGQFHVPPVTEAGGRAVRSEASYMPGGQKKAVWYRGMPISLMPCALLVFCVPGFLIRRRFRDRRNIEDHRAYIRRLTEAQELEKKRLAGELHDSLGQHLVMIRSMALLSRSCYRTAAEQFEAISDQAAEAIQELEEISYSLRPYQLDRLGLTKALGALLRRYRENTDIVVIHEVEDVDVCLPQHLQINFYRIIQESMTNALRHSGAARIQVRVWRHGEVLQATVSDDGGGFTRSSTSPSKLGLVGMEERAASLGGWATFVSSPGAGTHVHIRVPVQKIGSWGAHQPQTLGLRPA